VPNDAQSFENVIVVSFEADSSAYEALTRLKELDSQEQVGLEEAAVVVRDQDGTVETKDQVANDEWTGTAGGGLIGLLIGIIGGPVGVLIGGATGLLVGSLFDLDDADETDSVLSEISASVRVGHTSLLAELATAMAHLGGTVLRRSVADVEAEMAAAEKAQRKAKREARKELLKARHEKNQAKAHAKVEELKAKLHPHKAAAGSAS
jgi:uncharacterized membrane protein